MIRRLLRFRPAVRVAEVMGQLPAERALDQRLLESTDRSLELLNRDRSLLNKLVKNFRGNRGQWCFAHQSLATGSGHIGSSWYAPHTKFLTRSTRSIFTFVCLR